MLIKSFAVLASILVSAVVVAVEGGGENTPQSTSQSSQSKTPATSSLSAKKNRQITLGVFVSVDEEGEERQWKVPDNARVMKFDVSTAGVSEVVDKTHHEDEKEPEQEKEKDLYENEEEEEEDEEKEREDPVEEEDLEDEEDSVRFGQGSRQTQPQVQLKEQQKEQPKEQLTTVNDFDSLPQEEPKEQLTTVNDFDSLLQEEEKVEKPQENKESIESEEEQGIPTDIEDPRLWYGVKVRPSRTLTAAVQTNKGERPSRYLFEKPFFEERIPSRRKSFQVSARASLVKTTSSPPRVDDQSASEVQPENKPQFRPLRRRNAMTFIDGNPYNNFDSLYFHPRAASRYSFKEPVEQEEENEATGKVMTRPGAPRSEDVFNLQRRSAPAPPRRPSYSTAPLKDTEVDAFVVPARRRVPFVSRRSAPKDTEVDAFLIPTRRRDSFVSRRSAPQETEVDSFAIPARRLDSFVSRRSAPKDTEVDSFAVPSRRRDSFVSRRSAPRDIEVDSFAIPRSQSRYESRRKFSRRSGRRGGFPLEEFDTVGRSFSYGRRYGRSKGSSKREEDLEVDRVITVLRRTTRNRN